MHDGVADGNELQCAEQAGGGQNPGPGLGFEHIEQFEAFVVRDGKIVEHSMTVLRMVPSEAP